MTTEKEELMELDKLLHLLDTKFIVIDFLLNNKAYNGAFEILSNWRMILGHSYHQVENKKPTAI